MFLYVILDVCAYFISCQKTFDRVNWSKLIELLKRIGVDWRDYRLHETKEPKIEGLRQGVAYSVESPWRVDRRGGTRGQ